MSNLKELSKLIFEQAQAIKASKRENHEHECKKAEAISKLSSQFINIARLELQANEKFTKGNMEKEDFPDYFSPKRC